MAFQSAVYRVLIASPSDLVEERQVATDAIAEWNNQHAAAEGVVLLPEKFETHAIPQTGIRPQQAINEQLVSKCDILIAMFWTKYGNPTGVAESGTVEEIDEAVAAGKPVMLYFSARPIDPNKIDPEQQVKLKKFKEETFKKALVGKFSDSNELHRILVRDLVKLVQNLKTRDELYEESKIKARERQAQSFAAAQKQLEPHMHAFHDPHLRLWMGPQSSAAEIVPREQLFAFIKGTAFQNHLGMPEQRYDVDFQQYALFKNPVVERYQANVSCFEDVAKSDPWRRRDMRLSGAKFVSFDQFGFILGQIALRKRPYATRFGPGGGATDPVDSYCFWHTVLYLRHLFAWAVKFYESFPAIPNFFIKVSLEDLRYQNVKLAYGVTLPYESTVAEVMTDELHFSLNELVNEPEVLITKISYELLWSFGHNEPQSKEQVAEVVAYLWDGRDC